ncbi:MAG: chemotaxis protein CheW [Campylobacterales bacterium]|nr:chemotaxis protein CheW [Campylobacterales bacterium]
MIDLIVFSVGNSRYALNIENIQRIIQAKELTAIPSSSELIDGMMSHEGRVIKVLNFRKLIGVIPYDEELKKSFEKFKIAHQEWMEALVYAVENGTPFVKTTNPHKCDLGMWLDKFNSYDDKVSAVLNDLLQSHKDLHSLGGDILDLYKVDVQEAQEMLKKEMNAQFSKSMGYLDLFISELEGVSSSLQKLILYEGKNTTFAIKVDTIEDIAHIEESMIMNSNEEHGSSEYLELLGILDIDGALINIIKHIDIPK